MPNFTFYGGRKQATTKVFFLFLNLSAVPKKSTPGAEICLQRNGINEIEFEKTLIYLKSDFFGASFEVAVVLFINGRCHFYDTAVIESFYEKERNSQPLTKPDPESGPPRILISLPYN